ncbi:hypothetical protein [Thiocystis violacea]|uniref:hypothetical protein n=1 Tax=Thiocystis violacea TaxID=13725 RepID=UPI001904BA09|nr:hypothetical protein [Thiocystis violacea]MBK1722427.1 hypothetical protein [Thiocystis violacea]
MKQHLRRFVRFVVAVSGGTVIVAAVLMAAYRTADGLSISAIELSGDALQLVQGVGDETKDGLRITAPGANGMVMVQGAIRPFQAGDYARLRWQLSGLSAEQEVRFVWATETSGGRPDDLVIPQGARAEGAVDLTAVERWRGRVVACGLVVVGTVKAPLILSRIELQPRAPTIGQIAQAIWRDWTRDAGWTGRSINFEYAGADGAHVPRVLQALLWVLASGGLYLLLSLSARDGRHPVPYVAIALIGWLSLDLGWQWSLLQRLATTKVLYAGLGQDERQEAGPDRSFYPFLREIRQRIEPTTARLFIVTSDPNGYAAGRVRYHLFPSNSLAVPSIDPGSGVRAGDYILMMSPEDRVRFDQAGQALVVDGYRVSATRELSNASLGGLFRVIDGG